MSAIQGLPKLEGEMTDKDLLAQINDRTVLISVKVAELNTKVDLMSDEIEKISSETKTHHDKLLIITKIAEYVIKYGIPAAVIIVGLIEMSKKFAGLSLVSH